jgi:uncharacterized protein YycO
MLLGFSTDRSDWISSVIRKLTWSRFSHTVLISPDRRSFIESTHGVGVRELPIEEFLKKDGIAFGRIHHPNPQAVWDLARAEVGKPYDELYIYGYLFRTNWQDDTRWACSELVPAMAEKAGHPIVRREAISKISPEFLWRITTPATLRLE